MKITEIRVFQPATPGSPPDWRTHLGQILVEVQTAEGLSGLGVGGGGAAGVHIVQTVLRDLLLGADASEVEDLHDAMFRHTAFYGRSGLAVMAISGVDLALWDLRGKAAGQHVATLLRADAELSRAIPTYATVWSEDDAEAAIAGGHTAIKLHVERFGSPPDVDALVAHVGRIRKRLGANAEIMMDAFARWDVESTLRIAEAVQAYRVGWLEEPLPPDDFAGYTRLAKKSPIPIAGGEHEYGIAGFQRLIDERLHAVLQPDVNWCGGLTTLVQIYEAARRADVRVCPHRGGEPFALPAIAALDPQPLAESPRVWWNCVAGSPVLSGDGVRLTPGTGFAVQAAVQPPA